MNPPSKPIIPPTEHELLISKSDNVNHPPHYTQGGIECITVLEQLAADGEDFRILTAIKYLWRHRHKNGCEDLRKAVWYIERYVNESEAKRRCEG